MVPNYIDLYGCAHKVIKSDGCTECGKSLEACIADDADYLDRWHKALEPAK